MRKLKLLFRLGSCALVFLSLVAVACADSGGGAMAEVSVTCDEFQQTPQQTKTVTVSRNGTLLVTLCSNPSTGFSWDQVTFSEPGVIALKDHQYIAPSATPAVGAAGTAQWKFDAKKSGTTTLHFHYSQPWAGGTKDVWSLELAVTVSS